MINNFPLHRLGWQSFQDLCVALVEEHQKKIVQTFLPTNDAGRDGAFLGLWDSDDKGQSTIQCKFTSKEGEHLSLSHLKDELPKAERLAANGLADDYIILTNCIVTGESELRIKSAFQAVGVGCCRVFHRDWIIGRIADSPRLRMMMPRLYGMLDLTSILDARAYAQAQLILSQMGESLQKLVVTEAHRKSVRAIGEHSLVLLLGSPATGKSTIGASLALGANDLWNSSTIKSTSPEHLQEHIDPNGCQFFWIDDAWGSTQYQRDRIEMWNQVFPLMQGAMHRGTKFLITSRDYIWEQAKSELKLSALPALQKSQVVIEVKELTLDEKARILYNHVKLGNQSRDFKRSVQVFLPDVVKLKTFLPESARRLGNKIFTDNLTLTESNISEFFNEPKEFLEQTIINLSDECRAAIALIFRSGGVVRSPVNGKDIAELAIEFGVTPFSIKNSLQFLNGSLLLLANDDKGPYWTYHHPTISDAFASYLAAKPELIEIYLKGAKPLSLTNEVVCSGVFIGGASVIVPPNLYPLLVDRIKNLSSHNLKSFLSYRSEARFTSLVLQARPDLIEKFPILWTPLKSNFEVDFFIALIKQNLLSADFRKNLFEAAKEALREAADDSIFEYAPLTEILTSSERLQAHIVARELINNKLDFHINLVKEEWDSNYEPSEHFDDLRSSLCNIIKKNFDEFEFERAINKVDEKIDKCIDELEKDYEEPLENSVSQQQTPGTIGSLNELFRDVSE